jgi:hypothetical protein
MLLISRIASHQRDVPFSDPANRRVQVVNLASKTPSE